MLKEEFCQSLTCTLLCSTNSETCCYELKTKPMPGKQVQLVQNLSAHWTGVKHTHKLEDFRLSHFFGIFYKNKYTLSSLAQGTCHMKTVQPYFFLLLVSNSCFWLSSIKVQQKHTHKIFRKLWNIFCFFHSFLFFLLFLCGGGLCLVEVSFLNGTKQLSWCKVAVNKATV